MFCFVMFCFVLFCFSMKDQPSAERQMLLGIPLLVWKFSWRWIGSCITWRKKNFFPVTYQNFYKLLSCPLPSCLEEPLLLTMGPAFHIVKVSSPSQWYFLPRPDWWPNVILSLLKSWFSQLYISLPQVCQSNLHGSSPLGVSEIHLKVTGRKINILM